MDYGPDWPPPQEPADPQPPRRPGPLGRAREWHRCLPRRKALWLYTRLGVVGFAVLLMVCPPLQHLVIRLHQMVIPRETPATVATTTAVPTLTGHGHASHRRPR